MSLSEAIAELQEQAREKMPEEVLKTLVQSVRDLKATDLEAGALGEGAEMPSFSLPNAKGESVSSDDLLRDGPLVISFYRGGWCPYCNLELKALQDSLPEITDLGASLVAISPELPDNSLTTAEKNNLGFEVLSDSGNGVARRFGLVFTVAETLRPLYENFGIDLPGGNGDDSYELPMPATYVVGRDGIVKKVFVDADYTRRLEPADVVAALRD